MKLISAFNGQRPFIAEQLSVDYQKRVIGYCCRIVASIYAI